MYTHRRQNLIGRAGGLGLGALLGAALVAVAGFSGTAATQELITLHSFTGDDGAHPQADLIADAAGNLYGTTSYGGTSTSCVQGCGTVFELPAPASLTGVPGRRHMNMKRLGQGGSQRA